MLFFFISTLPSVLAPYHPLNPNISLFILSSLPLALFAPLNNQSSKHMYSAPPPATGCTLTFCSVKPYCNALTWNRCSRPIYSKLWVSSFHLQEQSGTFGSFELCYLSPPAPVAFTTLHTLDTELRFNSQNWLSGCLLGWCWIALGLDLSCRQWTVKSGYVLVVLRQCTTNSSVCWLWHRLADTPGPGIIRGLQRWPLQPNHPNEGIWPQKES